MGPLRPSDISPVNGGTPGLALWLKLGVGYACACRCVYTGGVLGCSGSLCPSDISPVNGGKPGLGALGEARCC